MITGAADTGLVGVMVGQASVTDSFTFYSRTQEASADQAAIDILCKNKVDGEFLINFLNKIESMDVKTATNENNYRSTHPQTQSRIVWINSSLQNYGDCKFKSDNMLQERFELLKENSRFYSSSY